MAESSSKQKSTNPFDSPASKADFPDTLNSQESDDSNTSFYDCQEQENGSDHDLRQTARRSANINFDKPFDDVGKCNLHRISKLICSTSSNGALSL